MEAAPRLPMISFELKISTEPISFAAKLKQYIATFYREDPEAYNNEIHNLEQLRASAARPSTDVAGVQTLKKYYCQLKFLRSRFPMEKGAPCAIQFSWKDTYAGVVCAASDIDLELMSVLYNVGALHSQLGASDTRQTPEGMKMACTHFQCAAWAFKEAREVYPQAVAASLAHEVLHFMEIVCLAQAQECILEKSMTDSRKCTIIAKVASQAVSYYEQSGQVLSCQPEGAASEVTDIIGSRVVKDWCRYIKFKGAYHACISLLYHGQHCEEQQKMGERCALYQAAADKLEEARKLASGRLSAVTHSPSTSQAEIEEALGFTLDVVEGKRKAAKNENEFIYHESVPEKDTIPPLQGASLVRPISFGANDPDVSGPDIFARLVPMEAHEASSIYSERKAELLRRTGAAVEERDRELDDFMTSLHQIDVLLDRLSQPQIIPQDIVDRAAALNARPQAVQALVEAMSKLSAVHLDVDSLLNEAHVLIEAEKEASSAADRRQVVSMPINDLNREASKYREALNKASESNEALHRAMSAHVANLKILAQPLAAVDKHLPKVILSDDDRPALNDLRKLIDKVEEMRQQRMKLLAQLREAARLDDITSRLALFRDQQPSELDNLFDTELAKHRPQVALIEQNLSAQQNILLALTDSYAKLSGCRKQIVEAFRRRDQIISALIASYDSYEDLLAKANKGIDFYQKLETNVSKLLQRLKSICRVQEEEREQKNASITPKNPVQNNVPLPPTPKLRDYLQPVGVRPAPLGSEHTDMGKIDIHNPLYANQYTNLPNGQNYGQYQIPRPTTPQSYIPNSMPINYQQPIASGQYQIPTTAPQYQVTTPESLPSPVNQPQLPLSKPQNPQSQVTSAMPQYQVAPSQYPQEPPPAYQYYPQNTQVKNNQYSVPQSPTISQGYSVQNTPQNYPSQYPGMAYQTIPVTTNAGQSSQVIKSDYTTAKQPQTNILPSPNQSGQYSNMPGPYGQYPAGNIQDPNKPSIHQNTGYPNPGYSNTTENPTPQNVGYPISQNAAYPYSNVGTYGQYPSSKTPSGYPNPQMNPGLMPGTMVSVSQQAGYSHVSGNAQSAPFPNAGSQLGKNQVMGPYSNVATGSGLPQSQNLPGTSQIPHSSIPNPNTQLTTEMQNMKISGNTQYPNQMASGQYSDVQQNVQQHIQGVQQYPSTGIPNTSSIPNAQINPGMSQYPTSNPKAASPQHHNSNSPQNYAKTPQQYSIPGTIPQNQQIISHSSYPPQNYTQNSYPNYQNTPVSNPTYQQNIPPKAMYQQPNTATYPPNNSGYQNTVPTPGTSTYRPQSPYQYPTSGTYYPQGTSANVDPSKMIQQPTYYHNTPPQNYIQNNQTATPPKKDSNIDLLAGLDFNVSQVPLDPVKAPLNETKEEINKPEKEIDIPNKLEAEPIMEIKVNKNPDRWKKERNFELDVNNLDNWITKSLDNELESLWKLHQKENETSTPIISVARCYPNLNRCPDSLPYDRNRFELPCPPATDDYINASKVQLSNLPPIIVTQAPLPTTTQHFWSMVANSNADLVICLMTDADLQNAGLNGGYWQTENGIQVRTCQIGHYWTERVISLSGKDVCHLQLTTSWPSIGSGDIITGLAELAMNVVRRKTSSIVIHCLTGVGRSGVMSVLLEIASELQQEAPILLDVVERANKLWEFRRNPIKDRLHLEFTYRSVLKMARTILPAPVTEEVENTEEVVPQTVEVKDPLEDLDPLWKLKT